MQQQPSMTQPKQQQQQQQLPSPQADSQFIKAFVAGGGAGLLAALITCPVEVVKTKLQVLPLFLFRGLDFQSRLTLFRCTHVFSSSLGAWRSNRRQI
jgi:hypothetical protein